MSLGPNATACSVDSLRFTSHLLNNLARKHDSKCVKIYYTHVLFIRDRVSARPNVRFHCYITTVMTFERRTQSACPRRRTVMSDVVYQVPEQFFLDVQYICVVVFVSFFLEFGVSEIVVIGRRR